MKKIKYILLTCIGIAWFSCDSFLEETPTHSLSEANAITDFSKAQATVAGIYATFQNDNWAGALYVAQASKAGFVNWSVVNYDMEYVQADNPGASIWTSFYTSLNAANFAINGIPQLSAAAVPSEEARESLIAEARCLRAWINANLLWNFGHWWAGDEDENGLLYRDEVVNLANAQKARISVGESYQKIYEDLDYAIEHLDNFATPRYVSKHFAKVLKAKLLLYRGGYNDNATELSQALTLVNDVLNDHPASFAMESDLEEMYDQAWDSKENLFVKYLEDDGSRGSTGGYWYTYGLAQIVGDRLPLAPGAEYTAGLEYGDDWFKADPRWDVVTGPVRGAETWDDTYRWTWKKLTRLGRYAGRQVSPPNEKYAAYYFRYAELYIMKAELLARTGATIGDAIAPINEMRGVRTNPALPDLVPADQNELMDMIFQEYFFELFLENGSEFFAATRFQKNGQPWIQVIKGKPLEENKMPWPIPDAEIVNNQLMDQNPDLK